MWHIPLEFASHFVAPVLAALLVARRGGQWAGPAFLGLMLGWSSLPLLWLLTREPRPTVHRVEHGLNRSEPQPEGTDWDEWLSYYYNLRQDLVVQSLLLLICLGYLFLTGLSVVAPQVLGSVVLGFANDSRLADLLWVLLNIWPTLAGALLLSGYWLPWLGPVWRYADQIWRGSGLVAPQEVSWRPCRGAIMELEEARLALLEAVRRTRGLHWLTLFSWLLMVAILGVTVAREVLLFRSHLQGL